MDLFRIAIIIAADPLLMMEDMGYEPRKEVDLAVMALEDSMDHDEAIQAVISAMVTAWKKTGLPDPDMEFQTDAVLAMHELEHMILDPEFVLRDGRSRTKSFLESLMDEIFSWKLSGGVDDETKNTVAQNIGWQLGLKDGATAEEIISAISAAPFISKTAEKIRDAAVREIRQNTSSTSKLLDIEKAFVKAVEKRLETWRKIMTQEREEAWRRFQLRFRSEIKKLKENS